MFHRLANLIRGFFGLFLSGAERRNPEALLELEKEHLREQIAHYNQGLATHAGLCERLMAQIRKLQTEERELRAKTTAHLQAGIRDAAAQYALRLQTVQRELTENQTQLQQAEATYRDLTKARDVAVQAARAKLEALKQGINDLKVKRAMAELTEMATGMVSSMGSAGETLDRLHEMVEEERQKAAGRARVARDSVEMGQIELKEAENKALGEQALAEFAAREGITIKPLPSQPEAPKEAAAAEDVQKKLGPAQETQ